MTRKHAWIASTVCSEEKSRHRQFRPQVVRLERRDAPAFGPIGPEFRLNDFTTGDQSAVSMASDAAGNFVAVWISPGKDGSGTAIVARRFLASGVPQGNEFVVNNLITVGDQIEPSVAMAGPARII